MGRCPRINPYRSRAASTDTTRTTDTHRENTSQQHHETILCFWAFLTQRPSVTKEVLIKTKFSHWTEPDGHEWCKIFPMIHFSPFRLVCQFCGFILKAATDKSFLCVCLTWIMKSFSSSTSHTHLTTSHSSVSVPTGQEGVSSPLSAVSVDQSLPSSAKSTETQFLNFYIASVFVILVCVCFPTLHVCVVMFSWELQSDRRSVWALIVAAAETWWEEERSKKMIGRSMLAWTLSTLFWCSVTHSNDN